MNEDYGRLRVQAERLHYRFNDSVDDRQSSGQLKQDIRDIVDAFEMSKNPHSIEDMVKRVQQQLRSLDNAASPVMDAGDIDELVDGYEELRADLRELDNY